MKALSKNVGHVLPFLDNIWYFQPWDMNLHIHEINCGSTRASGGPFWTFYKSCSSGLFAGCKPDLTWCNPDVTWCKQTVTCYNPDVLCRNPDLTWCISDLIRCNPTVHGSSSDVRASNPGSGLLRHMKSIWKCDNKSMLKIMNKEQCKKQFIQIVELYRCWENLENVFGLF